MCIYKYIYTYMRKWHASLVCLVTSQVLASNTSWFASKGQHILMPKCHLLLLQKYRGSIQFMRKDLNLEIVLLTFSVLFLFLICKLALEYDPSFTSIHLPRLF